MTINTQKLRRLINDSRELPWTLATSNSWRRIVDARHNSVCTPITQPDGHPDLLFFGGPDGPEAQLLIDAANALPELLDRVDDAFALGIIVESVAAAFERHGVTSADDPGEAIDVLIADKDREIARLREAQADTRSDIQNLEASRDGYRRDAETLRDALLGLLDALPSATTHPAIKRAKDALRETCHD